MLGTTSDWGCCSIFGQKFDAYWPENSIFYRGWSQDLTDSGRQAPWQLWQGGDNPKSRQRWRFAGRIANPKFWISIEENMEIEAGDFSAENLKSFGYHCRKFEKRNEFSWQRTWQPWEQKQVNRLGHWSPSGTLNLLYALGVSYETEKFSRTGGKPPRWGPSAPTSGPPDIFLVRSKFSFRMGTSASQPPSPSQRPMFEHLPYTPSKKEPLSTTKHKPTKLLAPPCIF